MRIREGNVAGRLHVIPDAVEKIEAHVNVHEHVRVRALPIEKAGALRQLVPDRAGAPVLIPEDELQLLAGADVCTLAQQCIRGDESVAGEEPGVLWPALPARRTVPGERPAAELRVAHPRLLQRHLRPAQRAIHGAVGRRDLEQTQRRVPLVRRQFQRICASGERLRDGDRGILGRRARAREDDTRLAGVVGAQREGEVTREVSAARRVLPFVVHDDLTRDDGPANAMRRLVEHIGGMWCIPVELLAADGARPHEIQRRREMHCERHGTARLDRVGDRRCRDVRRREDAFAHRDIVCLVDARRRHGGLLDAPERRSPVDHTGITVRTEGDAVSAQELHRRRPHFETGRAVSADEGAPAGDDDVSPWSDVGGVPAQVGERRPCLGLRARTGGNQRAQRGELSWHGGPIRIDEVVPPPHPRCARAFATNSRWKSTWSRSARGACGSCEVAASTRPLVERSDVCRWRSG